MGRTGFGIGSVPATAFSAIMMFSPRLEFTRRPGEGFSSQFEHDAEVFRYGAGSLGHGAQLVDCLLNRQAGQPAIGRGFFAPNRQPILALRQRGVSSGELTSAGSSSALGRSLSP